MPDVPVWYRRVNEILVIVEATDTQLFDRTSMEGLFGIKKTAAVHLMRRIGGVGRVGQSQTVDRRHLLLFLNKVQASPGYGAEAARVERIEKRIESERRNLAARRRLILIERHLDVTMDGLPGVLINNGRLTVEFSGTEDLLRKLYELSQAIVQDWTRFERLAEPESRSFRLAISPNI